MAFDVYDANNDEKISELDLFKCVFHLSKVCPEDATFQSVLMSDVCQLTKMFRKNFNIKQSQVLKANKNDENYIERVQYFRNL